jgi:hypothetical protein
VFGKGRDFGAWLGAETNLSYQTGRGAAPSRRCLFSAGIINGLFQINIEGRQNSPGCLWKGGQGP